MAEKVFVVTVNITVVATSQRAAEHAAEAAAHRTHGGLDACVVGSEKLDQYVASDDPILTDRKKRRAAR